MDLRSSDLRRQDDRNGSLESGDQVRSVWMDCPACKKAMITLELADVEIDHCISCGGIWLDNGEL